MSAHPLIYEVPTRAWLAELSPASQPPIRLREVPDAELDRWQASEFTHIWLMGIWKSGGVDLATYQRVASGELSTDQALTDWIAAGHALSPYAIYDYEIDPDFGTSDDFRHFRERLRSRHLKLILDFVPNHVGLLNVWEKQRPQIFLKVREGIHSGEIPDAQWTHGRDPYFAPWTDTFQLDIQSKECRCWAITTLLHIAQFCDGVRCDMGMLVLDRIFTQTWGATRATPPPSAIPEYWHEVIQAVRSNLKDPSFLFLAEVYWGLEHELIALGFDLTYQKELMDHLVRYEFKALRASLESIPPDRLAQGVHFLENHDEERAASRLPSHHLKCAWALISTLPGARLLYWGQEKGWRQRCGVPLKERVWEADDPGLDRFYAEWMDLLAQIHANCQSCRVLFPSPSPVTHNPVLTEWRGAKRVIWVLTHYHPEPAQGLLRASSIDIPRSTRMRALNQKEVPATSTPTAERRENGDWFYQLPPYGIAVWMGELS